MIEIKFYPIDYKVTVKGHAKAVNENGDDLICASASMLLFTLVECVKRSETIIQKGSIDIKVEEGDSYVSCTPLEEYREHLNRTYWAILIGFDLLASQYPKNVNFEVVWGVEK